ILDSRLDRTVALATDLETHAVAGHACDVRVPATEAYVAELERRVGDPAALVGHHYVRYLGDLSGRQIIKPRVRRHYGVEDRLRVYDLERPQPKLYKDGYRAARNALPLTDTEREATLAAATRAFDLNHQILLDLEAAGIC